MNEPAAQCKRAKPQNELFKSIFKADSFRETFNRNAALLLLKHTLTDDAPLDDDDDETNENEHGTQMSTQNSRRVVEQLIETSMGESFIEVKYEKAAMSGGVGRWFAKHPSSMQRMPRRIRHTLCAGLWIDLVRSPPF
jgi:hypothetical protein